MSASSVPAKKNSRLTTLFDFSRHFLFDPDRYFKLWLLCTTFVSITVSFLIIKKVPVTEIDWQAYMDQIEIFENGERDYVKIVGRTGPLVYPAGFVYFYSALKSMFGSEYQPYNQYIFALIYCINIFVCQLLFVKWLRMPKIYSLFFLVCSKRLVSLSLLRGFNDLPTAFLLHVSMFFFASHDHKRLSSPMNSLFMVGCTFYSLACSVKMNAYLCAPALAWFLLKKFGFNGAFFSILYMGAIQIALGLPFLLNNPLNYVKKSFELNRVFMHKWTVNFQFLNEETFVRKELSVALLILTLMYWGMFLRDLSSERQQVAFDEKNSTGHDKNSTAETKSTDEEIVDENKHKSSTGPTGCDLAHAMLVCKFIGVCFSRTLHYQFYLWYGFSLPYLVYSAGGLSSIDSFWHYLRTACSGAVPINPFSGFNTVDSVVGRTKIMQKHEDRIKNNLGSHFQQDLVQETNMYSKKATASSSAQSAQRSAVRDSLRKRGETGSQASTSMNQNSNSNVSVEISAADAGAGSSSGISNHSFEDAFVCMMEDCGILFAHFVVLILIELCYNWPKDVRCKNYTNPTADNPMPDFCENPATWLSSSLLQFLHLFVLSARMVGGKNSGYIDNIENVKVKNLEEQLRMLD